MAVCMLRSPNLLLNGDTYFPAINTCKSAKVPAKISVSPVHVLTPAAIIFWWHFHAMPIMQYKSYGRDGSASVRPHFPEVASGPMDALATEALTQFSAERFQGTQYRIADISAGDSGQPAGAFHQRGGLACFEIAYSAINGARCALPSGKLEFNCDADFRLLKVGP